LASGFRPPATNCGARKGIPAAATRFVLVKGEQTVPVNEALRSQQKPAALPSVRIAVLVDNDLAIDQRSVHELHGILDDIAAG